MKRFAFLFFLLPVAVFAQSKPDDYSITVHVTASRIVEELWLKDNLCFAQQLNATINGKKYELKYSKQYGAVSLLRVGDYRAKLIEENNTNSYELNQVYEFKFADGKARKFEVVGVEE
jgi:hypothetical protein